MSNNNLGIGVEWIRTYPEDLGVLLKALTGIGIEYALAQVRNGAHIVQIFEATEMMIKDNDDGDGDAGE